MDAGSVVVRKEKKLTPVTRRPHDSEKVRRRWIVRGRYTDGRKMWLCVCVCVCWDTANQPLEAPSMRWTPYKPEKLPKQAALVKNYQFFSVVAYSCVTGARNRHRWRTAVPLHPCRLLLLRQWQWKLLSFSSSFNCCPLQQTTQLHLRRNGCLRFASGSSSERFF